jgi:hypothetical protein
MDLAWLHPRSSSAPGPDCIGTYSASLANPFFYSSLGYHPFRSSSDIYAVAYSVTSFLHSSQHTQRFLGLGRLPLWRGRFSLRPFICAAPTQAVAAFAYPQLPRLWYWRTNSSDHCEFRIPLLFISLLWGCFIWCVD